jgi:hypothetical protein
MKYYVFVNRLFADQYTGRWTCDIRIKNKNKNHPKFTVYKEEYIYLGEDKPTQPILENTTNKVLAKFKKDENERRIKREKERRESKFDMLPGYSFEVQV